MRLTARIDDELIIGKQGENGAVTVCFPVSSIFKEFGKQGEFVILHRRAEDEASYPCEAVLKGDTVEWTVSNADNAQVGMGQLELRYIVNGRTVKSPTWRTRVLPALEEPTDIPPEPYESWVDNVTAAGAAAVQAKEAIVNMSVSAQQTDSASVNKSVDAAGNVQLNFGIPRGLPGYTPRKGVDYYTPAEVEAIKEEVTPVKGRDYFDGAPGYTPRKGIDYYTPTEIADIKAEVTPVKGRDYFDGQDGYTPRKGIDYFDGEPGEPGRTPVKGVDYFTETDKAELVEDVVERVPPYDDTEIKGKVAELNEDITTLDRTIGADPADEVHGEILAKLLTEEAKLWAEISPMLINLPSEEYGSLIAARLKEGNMWLEKILLNMG